jgi:Ni,Fe-hydrogenase I large subunit
MVVKEITIEPVTRLEGHLGVHAKADMDGKVYTDARSFGTISGDGRSS